MAIVASRLSELRKKRKDGVKKRKNYFTSLLIAIFLWFMLALTIIFIDPTRKGALEIFFITFFFANLFTFSLLLGHTRRGFLVALSSTLFFFLLYLGVGTLLNLVLICSACTMFEIYFTKTY